MSYRPSIKNKAPQINLPHPKHNKDLIYAYFDIDSEDASPRKNAKCKLCKSEIEIVVGSDVYSSYTSGMNWHLRKHPSQWQDYLDALGKTIKPDEKSMFQHYQSMDRVNVNYNKEEASRKFQEANRNYDLNKKIKNCAGVRYLPRDCEVLKGKLPDHAKYDIADILRHLHQFTNRNVHIFELMGTMHENAPLRANYKMSKCLVDNDEDITKDLERLLCTNMCFFDPKLYGECDHQGDISLFSDEEYQNRFPGFKEEIEKFPDFQVDKSFDSEILKQVRKVEHDKTAVVEMRRMLLIILTLVSCQKKKFKEKIEQIVDSKTGEDNIRKSDFGVFMWGPKVTDIEANVEEDASISVDEKVFYTHVHRNNEECPAYNDRKKAVYKEVFFDDGQAYYPCNIGGCCRGCPCIPCNSQEYKEPNSFKCPHHNPDHPEMFYEEEDIALERREYFNPYTLAPIFERPKFHKNKCPPKIKFAKMKKICKHCVKIFDDHRQHHHVLHDACQLCNHMNSSSEVSFGLTCHLCFKTYVNKYRLAHHMKSHEKENPAFSCEICDTIYTRKCNLDEHVKLYHSEKREVFLCETCKATFSCDSSLRRHIKTKHSDTNKEFNCNSCDKTFNRHDNLLKHVASAHNTKRNTFILPGINDEVNNFQCLYCEKKYTQKFSLIRHIESKHSDKEYYHCNMCDKSFKRRDVLQVHQQTHAQ
jgi:hypothetical protein